MATRRPFYHEALASLNLDDRPATTAGYPRVLLTTSNSISFPPQASLMPRRLETGALATGLSSQSLHSPGSFSTQIETIRGRPFGALGAAPCPSSSSFANLNGGNGRHSAKDLFEAERSREIDYQWYVEARWPGRLAHHDSPLRSQRFCAHAEDRTRSFSRPAIPHFGGGRRIG